MQGLELGSEQDVALPLTLKRCFRVRAVRVDVGQLPPLAAVGLPVYLTSKPAAENNQKSWTHVLKVFWR